MIKSVFKVFGKIIKIIIILAIVFTVLRLASDALNIINAIFKTVIPSIFFTA